ncbi:MAG: F0F1 ATP synthase subunit gamma [Clostridium sp.]|nr:F0F1 ATP synthase subunit gamma [Clostridium sp.]
MGAAGLIEIKRRLKSVQSTMKITKAMGLVATSKLRKSRKELSNINEYAEIAMQNLKSVAGIVDENLDIPYFSKNDSEKILYIIITSDSGLCGGYNNNVVSYFNSLVEDKNNVEIINVGSRGSSYLSRLSYSTIAEYVDIPDVPTIKEVKTVYEKALNLFITGEVSEVRVVYTEFESPIKQVPKYEVLLPVEKEGEQDILFDVEPNIEEVITNLLDIYLKGKLRKIMLSAKCSEQSARMSAMDTAAGNAKDIIDNLNLKYNRIRQAAITQEISEIVGGANAQNN